MSESGSDSSKNSSENDSNGDDDQGDSSGDEESTSDLDRSSSAGSSSDTTNDDGAEDSDRSKSGEKSDGGSDVGTIGGEADEGARRVGKMEDFEKLRELSAHMDHVVRLLARCFPLEGGDHLYIGDAASATSGLHSALQREGRGQARANAEDRAACLGRETTGRAVSANRALQHDSGPEPEQSNQERTHWKNRREGDRSRHDPFTKQHPFGTGTVLTKGAKGTKGTAAPAGAETDESVTMTRAELQSQTGGEPGLEAGPDTKRLTRDSSSGADEIESSERPRNAIANPYERLLWEELRDSLAVAAEAQGALYRGYAGVDDERATSRRVKPRVLQRQELVDQAITALLADSDEEGLERSAI